MSKLSVTVLLSAGRHPVSGRPQVVLVSAAEERRMGAEEAEKVARFMGLAEEPRNRWPSR